MALTTYGDPEVLTLTELADPPVGPDTVLVRTRVAGVNPVDWKIVAGRLAGAFPSHLPLIPGWDVAGVVERVGPAVVEYAPGDEVVGYVRRDDLGYGTYAELVPAPVRTLARKPTSVDFAHAGALPLAGLTALQGLRAIGIRPVADGPGSAAGRTVLVHAAAGGVGSYAVQLAVRAGARVLGTASPARHDYLRGLGATPVAYGDGLAGRIRAAAPGGVDAALDLVGPEALNVSAEVLAPAGRLASVTDAALVASLGGRYVFVRPDAGDLAALVDLVDSGVLRITVDRRFPLEEAVAALRYSAAGHARGKVVLEVG